MENQSHIRNVNALSAVFFQRLGHSRLDPSGAGTVARATHVAPDMRGALIVDPVLRHFMSQGLELRMSKLEFIANVAASGDISNAEAKRIVDLVFGEIENGLRRAQEDGKLSINGLGAFTIADRPARTGRHPRTGEPIEIAASKGLRFRPSSNLKAAAGC